MKIDLTTLKRIAKATPDLTVAQFVAVWNEKIDDENRARDRERHRKEPETERKDDGNPPTYEEQEGALYALAKQICGGRAGGFVTDLLKQNGRDLTAVRAMLERARKSADPKAFLAGNIRKQGNGTRGPNLASAFDDLIDRAGGDKSGDSAEIIDITPASAATG